MSLLGWVVGAAILDEWGRHEEPERELEERDRRIRELEGRLSRLEAMRGRDAPLIAIASRQPAVGGNSASKEPWRWRG